MIVALSYSCDEQLEVFLLISSMSLLSAHMQWTLWLKCLTSEPASEKLLIHMAFEGQCLFGSTLDFIDKGATGGKSTHLLLTKKPKSQSGHSLGRIFPHWKLGHSFSLFYFCNLQVQNPKLGPQSTCRILGSKSATPSDISSLAWRCSSTFQIDGTSVSFCKHLECLYLRCLGSVIGFQGLQARVSLPDPSKVSPLQPFCVPAQILISQGSSLRSFEVSVAGRFQGFYSKMFLVPKPKGDIHLGSKNTECRHLSS